MTIPYNGNPQQSSADLAALSRALGENPLTHWSYYAEGLKRLDELVDAGIIPPLSEPPSE